MKLTRLRALENKLSAAVLTLAANGAQPLQLRDQQLEIVALRWAIHELVKANGLAVPEVQTPAPPTP